MSDYARLMEEERARGAGADYRAGAAWGDPPAAPALGEAAMGKNPVTGLRDGEPFTILVDVDEAEIERRRQAALARRAARDAPAAAPPADRSWAGR